MNLGKIKPPISAAHPPNRPPIFLLALPPVGCTYAAVERINRDEVQPLLDELVKTPFFRYFKVGCGVVERGIQMPSVRHFRSAM